MLIWYLPIAETIIFLSSVVGAKKLFVHIVTSTQEDMSEAVVGLTSISKAAISDLSSCYNIDSHEYALNTHKRTWYFYSA